MRVVLTGACGGVGRAVWEQLLAAGHDVVAVDRRAAPGVPGTPMLVDLLDRCALSPCFKNADALIHLANHPGLAAMSDKVRLLLENMQINTYVFETAAEMGIRNVLFASSIQVIASEPGQHNPEQPAPCLPLDGNTQARPTNHYALSKHLSEELLQNYVSRGCFDAVSLRLPRIALPHECDLLNVAKSCSNDEASLTKRAQGFAVLSVRDTGRLFAALLTADLSGYRTYLPAATWANHAALQHLAEQCYGASSIQRPLSEVNGLVDISAIRDDTGWEPLDQMR